MSTRWRVALGLWLTLLGSSRSDAATLTRQATFTNGSVILAADFENEFNNLLNDYNGNVTAANLAPTLTFADGDYLDLSAINASANGEGLRLPQATSTSSQTTEGLIAWDTDNDALCVGDASANRCLDFSGDFILSQATPQLIWRDSSDDVAYSFHLDTATGQQRWDYFTLWRGSSTGLGNFTVSPLTPLMHFDSSNNVNFPTGGLRVGLGNPFTVNSTGNITSINNVTTSWPSTQGTANLVLSNDGSGTLSWSQVQTSGLANDAVTAAKIANGSVDAGDMVTTGTIADDKTFVADSATAGTWRTITNCTDTGGNHLNYTQSTNSFSCGTTSAGGAPVYGNFTRDVSLANGTQAITGVGFQPSMVLLFAALSSAVANNGFSFGIDAGATQGIMRWEGGDTADTTASRTDLSISLFLGPGSGARYDGDVTTLGADGFTVTWTKTGSPTGTMSVNYIAFR